MSEQLQLRRGTAAQIAANTPAQGEVWVDAITPALRSATANHRRLGGAEDDGGR